MPIHVITVAFPKPAQACDAFKIPVPCRRTGTISAVKPKGKSSVKNEKDMSAIIISTVAI